MSSLRERIAFALSGLLYGRVRYLAWLAALSLLIYGSIERRRMTWLLLSFAAVRGAHLLAEGLGKPIRAGEQRRSEDDGGATAGTDSSSHPTRESDRRSGSEALPGRDRMPRDRRLIACDALGLCAFGLLLPMALVLFTSDIASFRSSHGWTATSLSLLCVALYAWPHWWKESESRADRQALWWALPFLPALGLVHAGITTQHPYLDPLREDGAALRAERVLEVAARGGSVRAGAHADWVFEHASALERAGDAPGAIRFYRQGLHLAPWDAEAHHRLRALETRLEGRAATGSRGAAPDPRYQAAALPPHVFARLPFWSDGQRPPNARRCRLDESLGTVDGTTVVVIPVGRPAASVLDAIADVMRREIGLESCVARETVSLPHPTRLRGLLFGRQWSVRSIVDAFLDRGDPIPIGPFRFLLVTNADIYGGDDNFVFSSTYEWGALVSYARYARFGSGAFSLEHRASKQALGAVVKSFGVAPSPNPDCVTSYSDGPEQFDAKGNRPDTETFARFRERVAAQDRAWRDLRARSQPRPEKAPNGD